MKALHNLVLENRELHWFIALAEHEHVTATAEQLQISQPTLSRAIARLERRLGVPLFDRHQNRLHLNKYGELFLAHAVRAVAEIAAAEQDIATMIDPERGTIALGFLHSYGDWLVPRLVSGYRDVAPGITFRLIRSDDREAVADDVRRGHLDLALSDRQDGEEAGLQWYPLVREPLCLLVPLPHRLAGRTEVAVAELGDEPFIAVSSTTSLRPLTDQLCQAAGFTPDIVLETSELSTVRALVAAGNGVAIVPAPSSSQASRQGVAKIKLTDEDAYRVMALVASADSACAPVIRRFRDYVRRCVPAMLSTQDCEGAESSPA